MQKRCFKIVGMTCAGCATALTHAINAMGGVRFAFASFEKGEATVEYDDEITSPHKLILAMTSAGYPAASITDLAAGACEGGGKDMTSKAFL